MSCSLMTFQLMFNIYLNQSKDLLLKKSTAPDTQVRKTKTKSKSVGKIAKYLQSLAARANIQDNNHCIQSILSKISSPNAQSYKASSQSLERSNFESCQFQ